MKRLAQLLSVLALIGTLAPAVLFFAGRLSFERVSAWMLAATALWFVATPFWMETREKQD